MLCLDAQWLNKEPSAISTMKVTSEADTYHILFCFVAGLCWAVEADELQVICMSNTG